MNKRNCLDFADQIDDELAPLKIIGEYMSKLTMEAGDNKDKRLHISFDELFKLDHAIHSCVRNIEKVLATS